MVKKYKLSKCIIWTNILNDNHPQRYGVCDTSVSLTSPASAKVYSSPRFASLSKLAHWSVWDHTLHHVVSNPLECLCGFAFYAERQSSMRRVLLHLLHTEVKSLNFLVSKSGYSRKAVLEVLISLEISGMVHSVAENSDYFFSLV